jgi:hypothetical protein
MGLELHITAGGPQLRVPTWPDVALAALQRRIRRPATATARLEPL